MISHPENLRCGKAGKSNVSGILGQLLLADLIVKIIGLFLAAAVIPQNSGAKDLVVCIQCNQSVHLSACTDSCDLSPVTVCSQLPDSFLHRGQPILRLLFRPSGMREKERIFLRYNILDRAVLLHQKKLHGRGTKIHTNVQHMTYPPYKCASSERNILLKIL